MNQSINQSFKFRKRNGTQRYVEVEQTLPWHLRTSTFHVYPVYPPLSRSALSQSSCVDIKWDEAAEGLSFVQTEDHAVLFAVEEVVKRCLAQDIRYTDSRI